MGCGASQVKKAPNRRKHFGVVLPEASDDLRISPSSEACCAQEESLETRDIRDKYTMGDVLGTGAFGQVRSASLIEDPAALRAVKVLEKDTHTKREHLELELLILRQLNHQNIIRFFDFFEDIHFMYFVTEHCVGGEVFEKILEMRRFTEKDAAHVGKQMLCAIDYIHQKRIVHRDVKAENFLLSEPNIHSKVKMIDFGMACKFEEGRYMSELCGSPHYVAPELIGQRYTELVDVWAFGVLLYLLMYGEYPYDAENPTEIMIKVLTKKIRWQKRAVLSPACLELLTGLLQHDFKQRFSANMAAKHSWFDITCNTQDDGADIPAEVIRSAHRKITSSRKSVDPEVEELRNQKLARLEEDWQNGKRHQNGYFKRPEWIRRENRLMTAPSSAKEPKPHHALSTDAVSACFNVEALGAEGEEISPSDDEVSAGRLPGFIRSSQSFPESAKDQSSSRLHCGSEIDHLE
mmetsp:Transcript_28030/g.63127  ORF Transcript_28030/g.63127 Transcript_28030/m.63127 type:complete len:463 (+) Transcript_28030:62-1450(+)